MHPRAAITLQALRLEAHQGGHLLLLHHSVAETVSCNVVRFANECAD